MSRFKRRPADAGERTSSSGSRIHWLGSGFSCWGLKLAVTLMARDGALAGLGLVFVWCGGRSGPGLGSGLASMSSRTSKHGWMMISGGGVGRDGGGGRRAGGGGGAGLGGGGGHLRGGGRIMSSSRSSSFGLLLLGISPCMREPSSSLRSPMPTWLGLLV